MALDFGDDDDLKVDINITPFVDVILVVLIIFMVTATQIAKSSIKVTLPDAATGDPSEPTSLGLTLTKAGELLLDGRPVTADELRAAIRAAKQADGDEVVCLIAADREVAYGRMVWLLDLVKSEGIARYAFNIDKADAIPPDPATLGRGLGVLPGGGE